MVDEEKHPGTKGFERRQGGGEARAGVSESFDFAAVDGFDEGVASWEVAIERAGADAGPARDVVEPRGCANAGEDLLGYFKDALTVSLRVGAGSSGGLRRRGLFFRHGDSRGKIFCNRGVSPVIYLFGDCLRFI
jgi:hypothetical protein